MKANESNAAVSARNLIYEYAPFDLDRGCGCSGAPAVEQDDHESLLRARARDTTNGSSVGPSCSHHVECLHTFQGVPAVLLEGNPHP